MGKQVKVGFGVRSTPAKVAIKGAAQVRSADQEINDRTVFIFKVPKDTTGETLNKWAQRFGTVDKVRTLSSQLLLFEPGKEQQIEVNWDNTVKTAKGGKHTVVWSVKPAAVAHGSVVTLDVDEITETQVRLKSGAAFANGPLHPNGHAFITFNDEDSVGKCTLDMKKCSPDEQRAGGPKTHTLPNGRDLSVCRASLMPGGSTSPLRDRLWNQRVLGERPSANKPPSSHRPGAAAGAGGTSLGAKTSTIGLDHAYWESRYKQMGLQARDQKKLEEHWKMQDRGRELTCENWKLTDQVGHKNASGEHSDHGKWTDGGIEEDEEAEVDKKYRPGSEIYPKGDEPVDVAARGAMKMLIASGRLDFREAKMTKKWFAPDIAKLGVQLKSVPKMQFLRLDNVNLGDEGAAHIAFGICNNVGIARLDLYSCCIGAIGAEALSDALISCPNLRDVNLGGNMLCNEGAYSIAQVMNKRRRTLTHLNLSDNAIEGPGGVALALALNCHESMKVLDLGGNYITHEGAEAFADALCTNHITNWGDNDDVLDGIACADPNDKEAVEMALDPEEFGGIRLLNLLGNPLTSCGQDLSGIHSLRDVTETIAAARMPAQKAWDRLQDLKVQQAHAAAQLSVPGGMIDGGRSRLAAGENGFAADGDTPSGGRAMGRRGSVAAGAHSATGSPVSKHRASVMTPSGAGEKGQGNFGGAGAGSGGNGPSAPGSPTIGLNRTGSVASIGGGTKGESAGGSGGAANSSGKDGPLKWPPAGPGNRIDSRHAVDFYLLNSTFALSVTIDDRADGKEAFNLFDPKERGVKFVAGSTLKFGKPDDPTALDDTNGERLGGKTDNAVAQLSLQYYGRPACSSCAAVLLKATLKQESSTQDLSLAVCEKCKKNNIKQPERVNGKLTLPETYGNEAFQHHPEWADWEAMGGERSKAGLGKNDPRELPGLPRMQDIKSKPRR